MEAIQVAFGRYVFLGIAMGATVWCGRLYKALLHQAAIYKTQALCIQTLQAFQHSAADSAAKDVVVIEAAKAAFGNTPTGLIGPEENTGVGGAQIIEIIKQLHTGKP